MAAKITLGKHLWGVVWVTADPVEAGRQMRQTYSLPAPLPGVLGLAN